MILKIFFIIYLSLYLFLSACSPMNIITSTTSAGVVVAEGDRTVGESVDVSVTCPDDGETQVDVSIPLDQIKVIKTKGHKKEIKLSEEVVLTMKYPSLDIFVEMNFQPEDVGVDQVFRMAASCIDSIADVEQVYDCKDLPKDEITSFLDQMTSDQFKKVQDFFETMPKLSHTLKVTNPNTKVESEVKLEGLASFFA